MTHHSHEWFALGRSLRERLSLMVRAPGWSADGATLTANQRRARLRAAQLAG